MSGTGPDDEYIESNLPKYFQFYSCSQPDVD